MMVTALFPGFNGMPAAAAPAEAAAPRPVTAPPPPSGPINNDTESKLRTWVEGHYTRISLREKDTGTKLEALYAAYTSATPPIHQKVLGRNKFAAMLGAVYAGIGPHRNAAGSVNGLYLLR